MQNDVMSGMYPALMNQIKILRTIFKSSDIYDILHEIDRTETLLPLFDPTAYMKIAGNIPDHKRVLKAVAHLLEEVEAVDGH